MRSSFIKLIILCLVTSNIFAITPGISGHSAGDIIAVKNDDQIAAWCDFGKQIINTQFNTLCVFNGNKQNVGS